MSKPSSQFQILLVEDSPSDAKLFEHALDKAGTRAKLYWVATAREALEYVRREKRFQELGSPSIIVTDLNLPGDEGLTLVTELRQHPPTACVPIIVLSGSREPGDVRRAYEAGANSYIVKPMAMETLISKIGTMVRYWLDIVELANRE